MKFNLLHGVHVLNNMPYEEAVAPSVVESDRDLVAAFGAEKFQLIPEPVVVEAPPAPVVEAKKKESK